MAIVIAPLTTAVMGAVSAKRSGVASGVNNAVARTAGLLAIAILNLVVVSVFASLFLRNLQAAHLPADAYHALAAQSARLAGARVPPGLDAAAHAAAQRAIDTAYVGGFRVAMLIGAGMALAASLMAALLVEGKGVAAVAREMARNLRARPRQNPRRAVGANPR
ncbi:MAG TPA: MFS transporter, partial [Ktedonobacterales bacterium]